MKKIATHCLRISLDDGENKIKCSLDDTCCQRPDTWPRKTGTAPLFHKKVVCAITGDLAFYHMTLGREDMSGHYCHLCDCNRSNFAAGIVGNLTSMFWLFAKADEVKELGNGKPLMGVKTYPWWYFITPLLHCCIRIGNDIWVLLK